MTEHEMVRALETSGFDVRELSYEAEAVLLQAGRDQACAEGGAE